MYILIILTSTGIIFNDFLQGQRIICLGSSAPEGVARNFSRRRTDVGYHGWERTFCDFRLAKIFTSGIVLACVLNPPSKPQPRIFFLSLRALKNIKRENRLRQTTMQAQIIPTCCTYLIITFILISEQPTNTSFIKYYLIRQTSVEGTPQVPPDTHYFLIPVFKISDLKLFPWKGEADTVLAFS